LLDENGFPVYDEDGYPVYVEPEPGDEPSEGSELGEALEGETAAPEQTA
jgi:hypothetical protein